MINLIGKCSACFGRAVAFKTRRSFSSARVCQIRASDFSWARRIPVPNVNGKLENSDLIDTELNVEELDTDVGHLERSYDEYVSEVKDQKRKLRQILTKKKMNKYTKEPNMLTFNEKEHMKFLHKSDPVQWSVEHLSESFPALPYAVKRILNNKWKPSNLKRIKEADAAVLENWEKLKRNELQASPAVLKHLKRFINKRENLKAQLENPQFFPAPDVPKKVIWADGPLTGLLTKYEKDIERLRSRHLEKIALAQGDNKNDVVATSEKHVTTVEEDIKTEVEIRKMEDDSFVIGKPQSGDKNVTLDDLKRHILEKAEKGKPLSKFDEAMLDKTLQGGRRFEEKPKIKEEINPDRKYGNDESNGKKIKTEGLQKISEYIVRDGVKEKVYKEHSRRKEWAKRTPQFAYGMENDVDLRVDDETKALHETDVGPFLQQLKNKEDQMQPQSETISELKISKELVKYYGTEKDKEMVERDLELLSGSCFWGSNEKQRKKSEDAATFEMFTINTNVNPHLSPTLKPYFTYEYPDKIEIPKNKRLKGKTYKVNDCYYDDDGEFLYRVPGGTQD